MCGIAGIFNRDGSPLDPHLLMRMTRTLIHRGPDEEGFFINTTKTFPEAQSTPSFRVLNGTGRTWSDTPGGNAGLGHRRLRIIDLATGQQPLSNEDGTIWVALNGEIYNYQWLKSKLQSRGHLFNTHSDTETIVHAYEEWGHECIERFRGMFAFALWDEKRQRLLIVRDRVGKKPLYYLEEKDRFLFGSELKSILEAPGVSRSVDMIALSDYLSLRYVPSPRTIFTSIRKLPAAHYAIVTKTSFEVRPYWDLTFEPFDSLTESEMIEGLLSILNESTRLRMISEVPLGAFLSGGVDSSAVVAVMTRLSEEPVVTNSISFSISKYDEAKYARQVAQQCLTNHHEFCVTPKAIRVIEKLAWHYDEPFADPSAVPTYYVSKTARENVTVSLSGDGGDENFAGYGRYHSDLREHFVRNLIPISLRRPLLGLLCNLYPNTDSLVQIFPGKAFISNVARDPVEAYFFTVAVFHEDQKCKLLNPDIWKSLDGYSTSHLFHSIYQNAPAQDHLSRILYLDIKTYLCEDILTKVDRASMAVSLEVRCPLLDHVFMDFAARIPSKLKMVRADGKHIFKKAMSRYLPNEILYRKKMGFAVPISEWLRKDLHSYAKRIVFDGGASRNYLQQDYLKELWNQHQAGIRDWSTELWSVMMLNLWWERFA